MKLISDPLIAVAKRFGVKVLEILSREKENRDPLASLTDSLEIQMAAPSLL